MSRHDNTAPGRLRRAAFFVLPVLAFGLGSLLSTFYYWYHVRETEIKLDPLRRENDQLNQKIQNLQRQQSTYASIMEENFGASVKMPDKQLKTHLNSIIIRNREMHAPARDELLKSLYGIGPQAVSFYDGFAFPYDQAVRYPTSKYVSNFVRDHQNVFDLIESLMMPKEDDIRFIVEAGSFVGSSANVWVKFARRHNATLLCIDTWEGDVNMWVLPQFKQPMSITYGRGHLYDNFIQNIIDGNSTDVVLPMAVSSLVGAKILWAQKFSPDVVYIDTAHEQGETLGELFAYWEILRPGGVLIGDDYDYFPAVKHDVDEFVAYKNLHLSFTKSGKTFAIKKPRSNS
mmetsp:Transcript_4406/g.10126  ORF Transcript_4406/g.10126 Transcript_4406/m.10126 type:complete len:344 (+) Transcript_4406:123-1154(+)